MPFTSGNTGSSHPAGAARDPAAVKYLTSLAKAICENPTLAEDVGRDVGSLQQQLTPREWDLLLRYVASMLKPRIGRGRAGRPSSSTVDTAVRVYLHGTHPGAATRSWRQVFVACGIAGSEFAKEQQNLRAAVYMRLKRMKLANTS